VLPGQLPSGLVGDVRSALTTGLYPSICGSVRVGSSTHGANAIGYITVDVANNCSTSLPSDANYFFGEILYDNVLIGDYQQVNPSTATGNYAGGSPMVSIRAIPEGGPAGIGVPTNLPYTFYDRYTAGLGPTARTADRRQPLPGVFAARYIQGGAAAFDTNFKIWREGLTNNETICSPYVRNDTLLVSAIVRFDEHENPTTLGGGTVCSPCGAGVATLPETSATSTRNAPYPNISTLSGDIAGWMYLNLSNNSQFNSSTLGLVNQAALSAQRDGFGQGAGSTFIPPTLAFPAAAGTSGTRATSQNWVVVSQFAEGRYSTDFDAAWLANGCTPQAMYTGPTTLVPSVLVGNVLICPAAIGTCTATNANGSAADFIPPPVNP
jgi:hypothetical protein